VRFLSAIIGAVVGAIVGLVSALFLATMRARNNVLAEGFIFVYAAPVGLIVGTALGIIGGLRILHYLREGETTGRARSKKLRLMLSVIVGIAAVATGMLWVVSSRHNPPSDRALLANFGHHESTFNQLVEMANADKWLDRVDEDLTSPKEPETVGVSPARITTYRRLLREARVSRGFHAIGFGAEVDFYYWLMGSAISSDTGKGYAYLTSPPGNLLTTLDRCRPDENNGFGVRAYRHIRGNWYLFYEYIPD
jgi:hypothetical protein